MDKEEISINQVYDRLLNIESQLLNQKKVLNFDEMSIYSGLSKSFLYKLTSTGGVPCFKPRGRNIYFDKAEVDNWLLQNRKSTNAEIENTASTFVTLNKKGGRK